MEFLNKIELRGIVTACVEINVSGRKVTRFTLLTENVCKTAGGCAMVDSAWFHCTAWDCAINVKKDDCVEITGRVRQFRYTYDDENERTGWEIVVHTAKQVK